MALTFSLVDTWEDGKRVHVSRTIVASGNYVTAADTLDLSAVPADRIRPAAAGIRVDGRVRRLPLQEPEDLHDARVAMALP